MRTNTRLLLVGVASEREPEIIIDLSLTKPSSLQDLTESDCWSVQIEEPAKDQVPLDLLSTVYESQRLILHFSTSPRSVRSLVLCRNGVFAARVLVHHPAIIRKQSSSSTQRQIRDAIGSLDSGSADLSSVIATVSKVIFSESTEKLLRGTDRREVHAPIRRRARNKRHLDQNRWKCLFPPRVRSGRRRACCRMAIWWSSSMRSFTNFTFAPLISVEQKADGTGGPEDGNGNGAEGTTTVEPNEPRQELSDTVIAAAVTSKSKTLMRRMINRLKAVSVGAAKKEPSSEFNVSAAAKSIVMQLAAVIALLRELRRIENSPRWSAKSLKLLDKASLVRLFEESMLYLFAKDKDLACEHNRESKPMRNSMISMSSCHGWPGFVVSISGLRFDHAGNLAPKNTRSSCMGMDT